MTSRAFIVPLGQRIAGVTRVSQWWEHKVTSYLGIAYAFAYHEKLSLSVFWSLGLLILLAAFSCAGYVSVINDITDQDVDARVGKPNGMLGRSGLFQAAAVIGCLLPGAAAAWLMRGYPVSLAIFALVWLIFTLYSVPPFRLKTRGIWGALADAVGERVLPSLLMAYLIAEAMGHELDWFLAAPLLLWSLAVGLNGILGHQLDDCENDRLAGVETVVTRHGPKFIGRVLVWVIFPVEVLGLLWLLAMLGAPLTWPILALCLLIETRHGNFDRLQNSWRKPDSKPWLPLIEYYKVYFPLTFLLALAWEQPAMLLLLVFHLALFPGCNRQAGLALASLLLAPVRGGYGVWHTGPPPKK